MSGAACPAGEAQSYPSLPRHSGKSTHPNHPGARAGWRSGKTPVIRCGKEPIPFCLHCTSVPARSHAPQLLESTSLRSQATRHNPVLRNVAPYAESQESTFASASAGGALRVARHERADHPRHFVQAERNSSEIGAALTTPDHHQSKPGDAAIHVVTIPFQLCLSTCVHGPIARAASSPSSTRMSPPPRIES